MFVLFYWLLFTTGAECSKLSIAGMSLLAYSLGFTFNHGWEIPSDFLDATFVILFLWATIQYRRWSLLIFALVASCNRESSAFAGVIWFFWYGLSPKVAPRRKFLEMLFSVVVSVSSYSLVILLRYAFGGSKAIAHQTVTAGVNLLFCIKQFLHSPSASSWPVLAVALCVPSFVWLWSNRQNQSAEHKRLLMAAAVLAGVSLIFGIAAEIRIFIPSIVILVYCAVASEIGKDFASEAPVAPIGGTV